jgi:cytochrome c-type biogenesis protein CcmF
VVEKRESLKAWTILLSIMAFGFSLIGTFIVRSGVLTSVHAFATDPARGMFILFILAFFTGGALILYAIRAQAMEAKGVFSMASRETALVLNNILLAVAAFVVFIGTVWPLVAELAFDRKLSVGAPFFNMAFTPFMVVLGVLLPVGAVMPWKRARLGKAFKSMSGVLALAIALAVLGWSMQSGRSALGPVGIFLGSWIVFGAMLDFWMRTGRGGVSARLGRVLRLPRADWGKMTAHAGLGITILGIAGLTAWQEEDIRVAQLNEPFTVGVYEITLLNVHREPGPNYISTIGEMTVTRNGKPEAHLFPEKRIYPVQGMPTTEAAIDNGFLRDLYLVIGDKQNNGGWAVRTYIKPLASWIWFGCIIMAFGGLLSLSDRRYRVAAGARKKAPVQVAAE